MTAPWSNRSGSTAPAGLHRPARPRQRTRRPAVAGQGGRGGRTARFWLRHFGTTACTSRSACRPQRRGAANEAVLHSPPHWTARPATTCVSSRARTMPHTRRVCIRQGACWPIPSGPRTTRPSSTRKSPEGNGALFADLPEALANTAELAKRCNLELSFGTYYLPNFPGAGGHTLGSSSAPRPMRASTRAWRGRSPLRATPATLTAAPGHRARRHRQDGFPGYFPSSLLTPHQLGQAQRHPGGPWPWFGAGIAGGGRWASPTWIRFPTTRCPSASILSACRCPTSTSTSAGSPRRSDRLRGAEIRPRDHVSQIITYGTMAAKAVVRDCGRVLGHPYGSCRRHRQADPQQHWASARRRTGSPRRRKGSGQEAREDRTGFARPDRPLEQEEEVNP